MTRRPKSTRSSNDPKAAPSARASGKVKVSRPSSPTRIEKDSMGEMIVPHDALFGATTQRAVLNFPVSGRPVPPQLIEAYLLLKKCCAESNRDLGLLDTARTRAIVGACNELLEPFAADAADGIAAVMRHFPIDVFQTGSGTSTNMNVNEVIANVASRRAGREIGSRDPVHPNDDVNAGQSSNDTFPTATQIAGCALIQERLLPALERLAVALERKAKAWDRIVKVGRTHLMDATPIRMGQVFSGYAAAVREGVRRASSALRAMAENLPIGGTAVGTGINAHPKFGATVAKRLSASLRIPFREAKNHFEAQATRDCVVEASGALRTIAVSLSKIAGDIRLLGSGPRCGLGELSLPATQPGSSIMPGKVNPVICESVIMVSAQVIGNDTAITVGGLGGVGSVLELNVAMPMISENLIESISLLSEACGMFVDRCIDGLEVNEKTATGMVERSLMMCTSLAPVIGYDRAAKLAKDAFASGQTVRELALEQKLVDAKTLDRLLDPTAMTKPGGKGPGGG
ncbi:MAG: class II fumarate hydratase [Phycisphaeraceae bacterium]|nr:class II fumarate hydratase [Phycisphaeraceae bacterium]